ncbi:hypothetical protein AB6A23_21520 [Paenibacillus tarimensis]
MNETIHLLMSHRSIRKFKSEPVELGIVYIGGIRNNPEKVSELLELPHLVYPLFGMCIGIADQSPILRPRLPRNSVLHVNRYNGGTSQSEAIQTYDETYRKYMKERTGGKRETTWSEEMIAKMKKPSRLHMKSFLQKRGFLTDEDH